MRVTNNMLSSSVLKNINASFARIEKQEWQLSSGKVFRRLSENPAAVNQAMSYRVSLKEFDQYINNLEDGLSWLDTSDTALRNATDLMHRVKELAVTGANATNDQNQLNAIANEVDQLLANMVSIGNTMFGGRYIFGGFETTSEPFTTAGSPATVVNYNGDAGSINYEVEKGVSTAINITGDRAFRTPTDVFDVLIDLRDHLLAGDHNAVSQDVSMVDSALETITNALMDVGAKTNRFEVTMDRLEQGKINLAELLSDVEDADIADIIMKLKTEEVVYQAALSTGSSIMQKSLIDFL